MGRAQNTFTWSIGIWGIAKKMMDLGNKYNLFECYSCEKEFVDGDKITTNSVATGYKRKWYHSQCKENLYIDVPDSVLLEVDRVE